MVEVPGHWSKDGENPPDTISLPDPRPLSDYPLTPCKHEGSLIKQARHIRQAYEVFSSMDAVKQALMRASAGQCGTDSSHCSKDTVKEVSRMDCQGSMAHAEMSEGVLFRTAMLHRFGLPYNYAKLEDYIRPSGILSMLLGSSLGLWFAPLQT